MVALDALVVGAGFSGLHILWKLRKLGFNVKLYESGAGLGGTWWWNRYPGARVDSETPIYQLSEPEEVWSTFEWRERFPGREELQRYFNYADQVLELRKDIVFNTFVKSAKFDGEKNVWVIQTDTGLTTEARHLFLCTGFASKRYTPPFTGLEKFKGTCHHSNLWPEEGVDLNGKRVAVIGTGASGVQIVQEIGPVVSHLTVYQRTPNLALPIRQVFLNKPNTEEGTWQFPDKSRYRDIFKGLRDQYTSLLIDMNFSPKSFNETLPEERRALYERLWTYGGFSYWVANFKELFFDQEANDEIYAFWAEKTRARLNDVVKKDLLAPLKPPHAWGTKRPCLETSYYEVFNQPNVDLVNVRESPILEITEEGVKTEKEGVVPVDVLILATGFDSVTGGILNIQIENDQGVSIQEKWGKGVQTFLGLSTAEFPNMYWFYGPHGPTAFSNGPTCGEIQANWVIDLLCKMRENGNTRVDATQKSEEEWSKLVRDIWTNSLMPPTNSWYQGANIPGKIREPLNWFGGIPEYIQKLESCRNNSYEGFTLV